MDRSSTMSEAFVLFDYDSKDKLSVLRYASNLSGFNLNDLSDISEERITSVHTKGDFGELIEQVYFGYEPNNRHEADFADIGVELKTTRLVLKKKLGWDPIERIPLNKINYNKVRKGCFDEVFTKKNSELLVIFYRYEAERNIFERVIDKVVYWTFTPQEMEVMREDWKKAEDIIVAKKAHELREGGTLILTWPPKGRGHGELSPIEGSEIGAQPRAIALKDTYVRKMYRQSMDLKEALAKKTTVCRLWDVDDVENIFKDLWDKNKTFEEAIIERLSAYKDKSCDQIEEETEHLNRKAKSYYSLLANRMLGVKTAHAAEIEDYGIKVKIIRLKRNRVCKESMSFPAFEYCDLCNQEWESSEFKRTLEDRFLFLVFQMTDDEDDDFGRAEFRGAFFWSIPDQDLPEVKFVWEDTVDQIRKNIYDDFQGISNTYVAHVRPHGLNNKDTSDGLDGHGYPKKSFWLNADYISNLAIRNLKIPILSTKSKSTTKKGKRRTLRRC